MNTKLWIGMVAVLTFGFAMGCRKTDADVSSDGKSLVVATEKGFSIHSPGGRDQDIVVPNPPANMVRWSHKQNQIAYIDAKKQVAIYSLPDKRRRVLAWKGIGPFAWTADDLRLAFVTDVGEDKFIQVVELSSGKLLAQEPAGTEMVKDMRWMPDGLSLVVSHQTSLSVTGDKTHGQFLFDGTVEDFAIQNDHSIGVLVGQPQEGESVPTLNWVDCDLENGREVVTRKNLLANRVPDGIRHDGAVVALGMAPNGTRIALAALEDTSPSHALRTLQESEAKLSKKEKQDLENSVQLEKRLLVIDLVHPDAKPLFESGTDLPLMIVGTEIRWSADSQTMAILNATAYKIWHANSS